MYRMTTVNQIAGLVVLMMSVTSSETSPASESMAPWPCCTLFGRDAARVGVDRHRQRMLHTAPMDVRLALLICNYFTTHATYMCVQRFRPACELSSLTCDKKRGCIAKRPGLHASAAIYQRGIYRLRWCARHAIIAVFKLGLDVVRNTSIVDVTSY